MGIALTIDIVQRDCGTAGDRIAVSEEKRDVKLELSGWLRLQDVPLYRAKRA